MPPVRSPRLDILPTSRAPRGQTLSRLSLASIVALVAVGACTLESAGQGNPIEPPATTGGAAGEGSSDAGSAGEAPGGQGGASGGGGSPAQGGGGMGGVGGAGAAGGVSGAGGGALMCERLDQQASNPSVCSGKRACSCDEEGKNCSSESPPPRPCPSPNDGGEPVCTFDCTGPDSCNNVLLDCSNAVDCRVRCSGDGSCKGATVRCGSGACEVTCEGNPNGCDLGFEVDCGRAGGDCTLCGAQPNDNGADEGFQVTGCDDTPACACGFLEACVL
jgi:hypothetical protein